MHSNRFACQRRFVGLTAVLLAVLAGCAAIQPARMDLPAGLEERTEEMQVTGLGGGTSGEFRVADYSGTFERGESRLGIFDPLLVLNRASSSYAIDGPGLDATVRAECRARQDTVTVRVVSVDTDKMHYGCEFRAGGSAMAAYFAIADPSGPLGAGLEGVQRRGEMVLGGTRLTIRSTRRLAGSSWQSETPIGYLMELDGRTVAAVELNGTRPMLFLPPRASEPELHRAALLAAMALAVFWDPADSMLGD